MAKKDSSKNIFTFSSFFHSLPQFQPLLYVGGSLKEKEVKEEKSFTPNNRKNFEDCCD